MIHLGFFCPLIANSWFGFCIVFISEDLAGSQGTWLRYLWHGLEMSGLFIIQKWDSNI